MVSWISMKTISNIINTFQIKRKIKLIIHFSKHPDIWLHIHKYLAIWLFSFSKNWMLWWHLDTAIVIQGHAEWAAKQLAQHKILMDEKLGDCILYARTFVLWLSNLQSSVQKHITFILKDLCCISKPPQLADII
jgi:hypothetical protein